MGDQAASAAATKRKRPKARPLVEEEEAELIPPLSDPSSSATGLPILRTGHFLPPRAPSPSSASALPITPILSDLSALGLVRLPPVAKILYKGWRHPQPKWSLWIHKLRPHYKTLWHKAGISLAISSSTSEIHRDASLLLALLSHWCPHTNTFSFPSSETSLTLEDILILSSLPALGAPVRSPPPDTPDFCAALSRMTAEHRSFRGRRSRKPFHYDWLNYYLENGRGDHLEHVAFLSLWLSRYVIPSPPFDVVSKDVFPLAILLAQGTRLALAPAVLASIYRDLRFLCDRLFQSPASSPAVVWAPFQLLQMWAWERFVALRPDAGPRPLRWDEPRAARWHALDSRVKFHDALAVLRSSPDDFLWRPYAIRLDDWCPPSFYREGSDWVHVRPARDDDDMRSFARCLRPCELVGVDCIERYLPHRVAMQFGFDQDLPAEVRRANANWEVAWATYDKGEEDEEEDIELLIPPRLYEADVTFKFLHWQRNCSMHHSSLWHQRRQ